MMQLSRAHRFAPPLAGLLPVLAVLQPMPAFAAQHSVEISVTNTGDEVLECGASIAHWFFEDLGVVQPGAQLAISFGYDLPSGTVFRLNELGDEMAVQQVWCGRKGEAWATRAEITLPRKAGVAPAAMAMRCVAGARSTCIAGAAE